MTPSGPAIIVEVVLVLLACLAIAVSARIAWTRRNVLHWLCVLGATALVLGVVGQRTYPNPDEQAVITSETSTNQDVTIHPGIWEAGVGLPFISVVSDDQGKQGLGFSSSAIKVTPLAVGGMLVWLVGLALVLFFEHIPTRPGRAGPLQAALEHDDSV